jgi:hypothetical protein
VGIPTGRLPPVESRGDFGMLVLYPEDLIVLV